MADIDPRKEPAEGQAAWSEGDERLWALAERRLERSFHPALSPSDESSAVLEASTHVAAEREDELLLELSRAARDLDFQRSLEGKRQRFSLGGYLTFLMRLSGTSVQELARDLDLESEFVKELAWDSLPIDRIPANELTRLLRKLQASWEFTKQALFSLVAAPRMHYVGGERNVSFRSSPERTGRSSAYDSLAVGGEDLTQAPNPEYIEQIRAVKRLVGEVRTHWDSTD